jgi:hypothetical protein
VHAMSNMQQQLMLINTFSLFLGFYLITIFETIEP